MIPGEICVGIIETGCVGIPGLAAVALITDAHFITGSSASAVEQLRQPLVVRLLPDAITCLGLHKKLPPPAAVLICTLTVNGQGSPVRIAV
jgi:hypothetical protein